MPFLFQTSIYIYTHYTLNKLPSESVESLLVMLMSFVSKPIEVPVIITCYNLVFGKLHSYIYNTSVITCWTCLWSLLESDKKYDLIYLLGILFYLFLIFAPFSFFFHSFNQMHIIKINIEMLMILYSTMCTSGPARKGCWFHCVVFTQALRNR